MELLHFHAGNVFGGVERMLIDLATAGGTLRHRFALSWSRITAEQLARVGPVDLLPPARFSRPWQVWRARQQALRLIRERSPDWMVTHSDWSHAIYGPVARRAGIPHLRFHHSGPGHPVLRWAARRRYATREVANSQWTADQCGVTDVIHPPVAPAAVSAGRAAVRQALGTRLEAVVAVMVSRLEPWKGHRALLDAFADVSGPDHELWMVGGPQSDAEMRYLAGLPRPARVRWLGQRQDVGALLGAADLYCQPNAAPEPFGIAIVEALYARLPVITTAVGGPAEVVTPACGVLVPPGDAAALGAALGTLLGDPARRAALGAAAPARARALCDPTQQVDRLGALLAGTSSASFPA